MSRSRISRSQEFFSICLSYFFISWTQIFKRTGDKTESQNTMNKYYKLFQGFSKEGTWHAEAVRFKLHLLPLRRLHDKGLGPQAPVALPAIACRHERAEGKVPGEHQETRSQGSKSSAASFLHPLAVGQQHLNISKQGFARFLAVQTASTWFPSCVIASGRRWILKRALTQNLVETPRLTYLRCPCHIFHSF